MAPPLPSTSTKRPLEYNEDEAIPSKRLKLSPCYQVMDYEEALRVNTIYVLDTGAEKMLTAIGLIKEVVKYMGENELRRFIVVLAPTVKLVQQHCDVIKASHELKTNQFYGGMGVDLWSAETWKKEISDIQVLVMTPQVLLDALTKAFLAIEMIELLIFDECHHATGNHQYTKIMEEFYHKCQKKPKVFGMSASLANKDSESKRAEVERILDSKIYTLTDRSPDTCHVTTAKRATRYYDRMLFSNHELKTHLWSILAKCEASLAQLDASPLSKCSDNAYMISRLRTDCLSLHAMIYHCLDDLGLICANEVAKLSLESVKGHFFSTEGMSMCKIFHEEVISAINNYLPRDYESLLCSEEKCRDAIDNGYISPKLFELLQLLVAFKPNQIRCLVFIENINTARIIECFLKKTRFLSHVNISYLTGGSYLSGAITTERQRETLELFRQGKINILFMSNMAEGGVDVDVPNCSSFICFDFSKTVCDYLLSHGRFRLADSLYIVMIERGNAQQRDLMFEITKSMHPMVSQYEDAITQTKKMIEDEEPEVIEVESTGAIVTLDSSIDLISRYCKRIPKDRSQILYPTFEFNSDGCCVLTLPPGSALENLMGPPGDDDHNSKQLVCLKACKLLHELKAFDDHLLPTIGDPMEIETDIKIERFAGAGTTKRKELHKAVAISGLSGVWVNEKRDVTLQGYKINFTCDKVEFKYSSFILLIDTILDKDVATHSIDLYLNDKMVKAYVAPCGPIHLEVEQVEKAKRFHELFFNGVFGKMFKGSSTPGMPSQFIVDEDTSSLWNESYTFLLLPLEFPCFEESDELKIYWKGITDIYSVVKYLQRGHKPEDNCSSSNGEEATIVSENKHESVHLVNKIVDIESISDMIVMAIHTGKFYSILEVVKGTSAHSPFEKSDVKSYADYFANKYDIVLQRPEQPLLLLKQSHNPHNLLSSNICLEEQKKSKRKSTYIEKPLNNVFMPPELLIHVDFPIDVLKALYLLPSVMHRMESLMLASQLRQEISSQFSYPCVPVTLILEAITTLRCCEDFSFERLELLGDSVLKYTLSCHLFLKYPEKHEGQLSSQRSDIVCNAMLHKLGICRNIQGYIRDAAFDPRRWTAPGQVLNRPSPCECTISEENPFEISDASDIIIGKSCDDGHRWICSKTISDCVEALIGAYYVGGGLRAAILVMNWLGIDVNIEVDLAEKFKMSKNIICIDSKSTEIETLESKIGYEFTTKGLLLEAITYASHYVKGPSYCYQRLEYLGDAALDILITWYLYNTYTDIDPGELTDLRSAAVNNETFARCAVKYSIQDHLQNASTSLLKQIEEYIDRLKQAIDNEDLSSLNNSSKGPKVLGDMVESIAGAILIDTKLDVDKVWKIFQPLLSPIVTPSNLELAPVRELVEIVSHAGYFLNSEFRSEGEFTVAKLSIQLKKDLLVREGRDRKKKVAKAQAAFSLLKDLEKYGLTKEVDPSTLREEHNVDISCITTNMAVDMTTIAAESQTLCAVDPSNQVNLTVNMKKGGPRTALAELCQKSQWPMPRYDSTQHILSVEEAKEKGFAGKNGFVASVVVYIPECQPLKVEGDMKPDKKNSHDSAAVVMLYLLQKQHRCLLNIIE